MKTKLSLLLSTAVLGALCLPATSAQESLRKDLGDVEVGKHWIYGDWQAAKAKAAKEKKPILALFR